MAGFFSKVCHLWYVFSQPRNWQLTHRSAWFVLGVSRWRMAPRIKNELICRSLLHVWLLPFRRGVPSGFYFRFCPTVNRKLKHTRIRRSLSSTRLGDMSDLVLYEYQKEVVQRALRGENIIVWLPTGAGKTRAAVYVAQKHLKTTKVAKVVVLVTTVHLAKQHYSKEFFPHLGRDYAVKVVSSDSEEKDFMRATLSGTDVLICTAQILLNALGSDEEAKRVELSDVTLLVVDECHHTRKETAYNKIMRLYLEKKTSGDGRLPQVLGLTASPGTGGAKYLEKAVEHVLQICANLDCAIVSTQNFTEELNAKVPRPHKTFEIVEKRKQDPFGDHVQLLMRRIHRFLEPLADLPNEFGTQEYEGDVVALRNRGVRECNRRLQQCAIHLREYNEALLVNDTLQSKDSLDSLEDFYGGREKAVLDDTDRFLLDLFRENRSKMRTLAADPLFENPKMTQLETTLLRHFSPNVKSRGIVFSKTRKSTRCLHRWVLDNHVLHLAGVKPAIIMGSAAMTQHDRDDAIRNFHQGSVNLLLATSVAEEGLDVPQCNLVVRYGLLTNEIAQQQASGRARARDSHYSLIARRGGPEERRESLNTYLEGLTAEAVDRIHRMSPEEFDTKIAELQEQSAACGRTAAVRRAEKNGRYSADSVRLLCSNCLTPVARGSDIQLVEKTHYVNVNPDFKSLYNKGDRIILDKTFEDWDLGCIITCNIDNCNKQWGSELQYRKVALLPNVAIKHFALETPDGRTTVKNWKDIPFSVEDFSFSEYCLKNCVDLLD